MHHNLFRTINRDSIIWIVKYTRFFVCLLFWLFCVFLCVCLCVCVWFIVMITFRVGAGGLRVRVKLYDASVRTIRKEDGV